MEEAVVPVGTPPQFDADDAIQIHEALNVLSPSQRQILTLFFLQAFSHAEIADLGGHCEVASAQREARRCEAVLQLQLQVSELTEKLAGKETQS